MSNETSAIERKIRRLSKILFYKRHRQPGLKGWELKKAVGRDYKKIVELLNQRLEGVDLQVQTVFESENLGAVHDEEDHDRARFYVSLKEPLSKANILLSGWRIDDVAALVVTVAFIVMREGKAQRRDVEGLLKSKFPNWRIEYNLNRFIRMGYLGEDSKDTIFLNWRSRVEIDQKLLLRLILVEKTKMLENGLNEA